MRTAELFQGCTFRNREGVRAAFNLSLSILQLLDKLISLAVADRRSLHYRRNTQELDAGKEGLYERAISERGESYVALLRRHGLRKLETTAEAKPGEKPKLAITRYHGSHFTLHR